MTSEIDVRDKVIQIINGLPSISAGSAMVAGRSPLPFMHVEPSKEEESYHLTFGANGSMRFEFDLTLYVKAALASDGVDVMWEARQTTGPRSVHAALHGTTLGGLVTSGQVTQLSRQYIGFVEIAGTIAVASRWPLTVVINKES